MVKPSKEVIADLEALLDLLKRLPDTPEELPPEQVKAELLAMGIDMGPAHERLQKMLRKCAELDTVEPCDG